MILSGKTIEQSVLDGRIGCTPLPQGKQIQPASLDVRLGENFCNPNCGGEWNVPDGDEIELSPGERYLATTKEEISLPNDIAAQLAGRSTIGRMGIIVHKTAGWIDPGFTGQITLEMMNLAREPKTLSVGQRIGQLVFFVLDAPSDGYDGHYQNQNGATEAYYND